MGRIYLQYRFHTALGDTPFRLVYGRDPPSIRSYEAGDIRVAAVAQSMSERNAFLEDVRVRLEQAQQHAKQAYDHHHREVSFSVGEWVWLRLRHRPMASISEQQKGKLQPDSMVRTTSKRRSMTSHSGWSYQRVLDYMMCFM
jgi:hypothetical protein